MFEQMASEAEVITGLLLIWNERIGSLLNSVMQKAVGRRLR